MNPPDEAAVIACDCQTHDAGYCEAIFNTPSREAVDQFNDFMYTVLPGVAEAGILRLLIDFGASGMPSIRYMTGKFRQMQIDYPNPTVHTYTAIVHPPSLMLTLMDSAAKLMVRRRNDIYRFFPTQRREDALAWLLSMR